MPNDITTAGLKMRTLRLRQAVTITSCPCLVDYEIYEIWQVDSQEIVKIFATRCLILELKCTKNRFRWAGAPPQTPLWELTALPLTPLAGFEGPTSKGRGGEEKEGEDD